MCSSISSKRSLNVLLSDGARSKIYFSYAMSSHCLEVAALRLAVFFQCLEIGGVWGEKVCFVGFFDVLLCEAGS